MIVKSIHMAWLFSLLFFALGQTLTPSTVTDGGYQNCFNSHFESTARGDLEGIRISADFSISMQYCTGKSSNLLPLCVSAKR
jgi:hypothetical protein